MLPSRCVREAVDELLGLRGEAVILIGLAGEFPAQLAQLARQIPVVEIGQRTGATGIDSVRTDDVGGVRQAVEHFVELGHRAIVHIDCGPLPGAVRCRVGYAKTCAHGRARHIEVLPWGYIEESGAQAARELLSRRSRAAAVLAGNDLCAAGLLQTLVRRGLYAPEELVSRAREWLVRRSQLCIMDPIFAAA